MRRLPKRNAGLAVILPFTIFTWIGCGLDSGEMSVDQSGNDASAGDAAPGEGSPGDAANHQDGSTSGDGSSIDDAGSDAAGVGPQPVDLGSSVDLSKAGSYALLAKTGITNATGSSVAGNLGVSPAKAAAITGFVLIADSSNVFATSSAVTLPAKVYASDYANPTPPNLTSAILSMQSAYTDAAGRPTPDFLNLGSGNIGGKTLSPGLYTWSTDVDIPDDVTFSGGANDVWILQTSGNLDESTGKNVILSGGAQAKNIFWQVAGQVTIHSSAHFEGIILAQTGVTLQTTASLHGRVLAQSLIVLDNNAITTP